MKQTAPVVVMVVLVAAGCASNTCPAEVAFTTAPVTLATTSSTLPRSPLDVTFVGGDADTLTFTGPAEGETFEVTTRYAEWASLTPGQRVRMWSDYTDATFTSRDWSAVSLFVVAPDTGTLLFAVHAASGTGGGGPIGPRTFADLTFDFEVSCTGPAPDCEHPDPFFGPLPTVDGQLMVATVGATTVRIERGETREIGGYRIYVAEASRESPLVLTAPCDAATGRAPRRGVVIARIE